MKFARLRRFRLATLFVFVSLIAVGLGIARWQRQQTLDAYRQLNDDGVGLILVVDNSSLLAKLGLGTFWLGHPRTAEIYISRIGVDEWKIGPNTMAWPMAAFQLDTISDKLRALGVTDIHVWSFDDQQPFNQEALIFASMHGVAGGGMGSQSEIDKRLKSLRP